MAILSDYHLHSSFSGDSEASMESMILKGIELELENMCFTEHMDMDYTYIKAEDIGMFDLNTKAYISKLQQLKEMYSDKIHIYLGVELGLQPHLSEELKQYVKEYDFDFIIGSSHICNKKDPYYPYFYENRSEEEAYLEYFTSIVENIKTFHQFDVYGHLDYVVRYGPNQDKEYSYIRYKEIIDQILTLLIKMGKGIEINTGGISYGLKELNPCTDIIKRYRELGGEIITVGSDAHSTNHLCHGFDKASDVLKACGFKYYAIFTNRTPSFIKL